MANFLSNALGNDGIASMVGEKAGQVVEDTVKKVLGGGGGEGKDDGEKKEDGGAGFNPADVLNLVGGGDKKEGDGGLDVKNVVGDLFR